MSDIFDDVEKMLAEEKGEVIEAKTSENSDEGSFNESELEDIMAEIESLESDFHETGDVVASAAKDYVAEELAEDTETELTNFSSEDVDHFSEIEAETETVFENDTDVVSEIAEELFEENTPVVNTIELITDSSTAPKTDLQIHIDQEMELAKAILEKEKMISKSEENVIPFENKTVPATVTKRETELVYDAPKTTYSSTAKAETSFQATGSMNLSLSFKLGDKIANLKIEDGNGLTVTLDGVELVLNEISGCTLKMESGVNINIPLTDKASSSKKMAS